MKGFTLIEILVAVGILALLAALAVSGLSSFQESGDLLRTADSVAGMLRDARGRTLASKNDLQYGVHFDANQAVLFEGVTYSAGAASNEEIIFPFRVEISSIALGGGSDVVFRRLSGEAITTGTIAVGVKKNPAKTKEVRVYESGVVEIK